MGGNDIYGVLSLVDLHVADIVTHLDDGLDSNSRLPVQDLPEEGREVEEQCLKAKNEWNPLVVT